MITYNYLIEIENLKNLYIYIYKMSLNEVELKDSYDRLESPEMDFNTFLGVLNDFHIALLTPQNEDGYFPTDNPFFIEVDQTSSSKMSDIDDVIFDYREEEGAWNLEHCRYINCYHSPVEEEYWTPPERSRVVVSSRPFTGDDIIVTMTSDGKILCEGHPDMVYLDDFESVYKKIKEACPDII